MTADDGLAQATVTNIVQDSTGFIWFGTYDGLSRFDGYNFKIFSNDPNNPHSVSHNFIRTLFIDSRGILWIGTQGGGLNLFISETEQFFRITLDTGPESVAGSNLIYAIFEDKSGSLWIGTWGGGLYKLIIPDDYDIRSPEFLQNIKIHSFKHDSKNINSLYSDKISDIKQDNEGYLWVGTRLGIMIFDPVKEKVQKLYQHSDDNPNSISHDNVSAIEKSKNNDIWIATWGGGLNKYDRSQDRFIRYLHDPQNSNSLSHNILLSLFFDEKDRLWIGTWGSGVDLLVKNTKFDVFQHFTHDPKNERSLVGNFIYDIYEDRTGVLWIGTDLNGVSKYSPDWEEFQTINLQTDSKASISSNIITAIYKDRYGIIWIGTRSDGLFKYNPLSKNISRYSNDPNNPHSVSNNAIRAINENKSGDLWIGTEGGLNYFNRKSGKFTAYYNNRYDQNEIPIVSIYEDSKGVLWIGNWGGGLSIFDPDKKSFTNYYYDSNNPNSISSDIVYCITESKQGHIWVGTENGLNLFNRKDKSFKVFQNEKNNPESISNNKILTLFTANNGDVLIGTTTGLNILKSNYDISRPLQFVSITSKDGLYGNTVQGIVEDNQGNFWLANGKYLTYLNPKTLKMKGFHGSSVLEIGELNVNSVYKDDKTGEMFFGGTKGLIHFHPDSIKDNPYIPNVVITNLKIFNKSVACGDTLQSGYIMPRAITFINNIILSYFENNISIEFTALHYNAPKNNLFAYRLFPYEKEWKLGDYNSRVVSYTNLDHGEYDFQVKASNNDEIWNETGHSLHIVIKSPYWLTWWFRIVVIAVIVFTLFIVYNIRTIQIRNKNKELAVINSKLNKEIRERRKVDNQIKLLNKELEDRVKYRTKELESFAYSISHDLRTPLRGIQGFSASLLEDYNDKFEDKGREYLQRIVKATNYMSQLIDDLLTLSRITRKELIREDTNLTEILEDIISNLKEKEPTRKVKFIIKNNLVGNCDKNLIRHALGNLIQNAWKFTSKQSNTEIHVGKIRKRNKLVFYIRDNGIGFDSKYADKLFQAFQRLHLDYEGTGIGLTIVQRIIQRHGGEIWAEGKVGKGATFYFTLTGI